MEIKFPTFFSSCKTPYNRKKIVVVKVEVGDNCFLPLVCLSLGYSSKRKHDYSVSQAFDLLSLHRRIDFDEPNRFNFYVFQGC